MAETTVGQSAEHTSPVWRDWTLVGDPQRSGLAGVTLTRTLADDDREAWPLPVLLHNLGVRLSDKYRQWLVLSNGPLRTDSRQLIGDLRAWTTLTRSLAARFPLGGEIPARMNAVASEVAASVGWAESRFVDPPADLHGVVSLSLNADLWAADQIREQLGQPRSSWFQTLFATVDDDVPEGRSEASIEQRIRRAGDMIIAGQGANLVADVLDALRAGPLRRDETPPAPSVAPDRRDIRTSWVPPSGSLVAEPEPPSPEDSSETS